MDKFSIYVTLSYLVTFVVLFAYLGWLWWRLRTERALAQDAAVQAGERP